MIYCMLALQIYKLSSSAVPVLYILYIFVFLTLPHTAGHIIHIKHVSVYRLDIKDIMKEQLANINRVNLQPLIQLIYTSIIQLTSSYITGIYNDVRIVLHIDYCHTYL